MSRDIRRIAVFRAGGLEEMLSVVPALRSLRYGFPTAEITLIGLPWTEELARQFCHYIDRFVPFPGYPGLSEVAVDRLDRFLRSQRDRSYDLAVQLHGGQAAANQLIGEFGAWVSAGHYTDAPPDTLTVAAPYPVECDDVERSLALVRLLGCPDYGPELEFPLLFEDRREASSLLRDLPTERPRIGLHPGSRSFEKRWAGESFAAVADELSRSCGASIVLLGDARERELARSVADRMEVFSTDLTAKTTLGGLAGVVHQLDLIIGNDSGPVCMARATGTPSITLAGDLDLPGDAGWSIHQRCSLTSCPEHVVRVAEQLLCLADSSIREIPRAPSVPLRPGPSGWAQLL